MSLQLHQIKPIVAGCPSLIQRNRTVQLTTVLSDSRAADRKQVRFERTCSVANVHTMWWRHRLMGSTADRSRIPCRSDLRTRSDNLSPSVPLYTAKQDGTDATADTLWGHPRTNQGHIRRSLILASLLSARVHRRLRPLPMMVSFLCLFVNLILVPVPPSPIPSPTTSSSSDSPLCTSITPSLFHSWLKTYLFH